MFFIKRQLLYRLIDKVFRKNDNIHGSEYVSRNIWAYLFLIFLICAGVLFIHITKTERERNTGANLKLFKSYEEERVKLKEKNNELEEEISELDNKHRSVLNSLLLPNENAKNGNMLDFFSEWLPNNEFAYDQVYDAAIQLAAMNKVNSLGVRITINDADDIDYGPEERKQIVHDADLRYLVDSIKIFYPIGISVNGERISSTSKIVCNGPSVQVNKHFKPAPFVIDAAFVTKEECDTTISYLKESNTYLDMLKRGLNLEITYIENMELSSFNDEDMIRNNVKFLSAE